MTSPRYYARSASDKTNAWPFWFVADSAQGGLNVTAEMIRMHVKPDHEGGVFLDRIAAQGLAEIANGELK